MRRTKEEAAQTRKDLLDAALNVFSRKGYHATRLADIAEAAGVTRGAIYHHFGSKAELYIALIEEVSAMFGKIVTDAIEISGTFEEVGTRIMVNSWVFLEENQRAREVTELLYYKTGDTPELDAVMQRRTEEAVSTVEGIAQFIHFATLEGELPENLDPHNGARAFMSYQNGVALQWLANTNAYSLKENAHALAKIFFKGLSGQ